MSTLSYIPFIEPINALHEWWYTLLLPLSLGVSMIYKALRMPSLRTYWREVAIMTAQVILAMIGLALALTLLVQVLIPLLPQS